MVRKNTFEPYASFVSAVSIMTKTQIKEHDIDEFILIEQMRSYTKTGYCYFH